VTHQTAEQVRAAKLAVMPRELAEVHHALWNEVAWLHGKWNDFRTLFGDVDLLNETAPAFFGHLQTIMWEDVLLHICRLTDASQTRQRHRRLTLEQLSRLVKGDSGLRRQVKSLMKAVRRNCKFAREWRNRLLAHKELPLFDGTGARPPLSASMRDVEVAERSIRNLMNCIDEYYGFGPTAYEHYIAPLGGVQDMMFYLKQGLEAERRNREALLVRTRT
jgi:hypothetical protein